jgi:hypothetical protein
VIALARTRRGGRICNTHTHSAHSRPFPVSASAYVELQQQLLQRLADDVKTSGLTLNQQMEWLREVCDSAAGEWAACVDDILTTARYFV